MSRKYRGNVITATRYYWYLIANDSELHYQVVNSRTNDVVFESDEEDVCLELLFKLTSSFDSYNETLIHNWNLGE